MSLGAWGDGGDDPYWNSEEVGEIASEAFRQGAQAMRELILRELGAYGRHASADRIRETWYHTYWGADPGAPVGVAEDADW